jgi:hypothetical protein
MSHAQKEFIRQVLLETRVFKALRSTVHEVLATVPDAIMASRNLGAAAELVASGAFDSPQYRPSVSNVVQYLLSIGQIHASGHRTPEQNAAEQALMKGRYVAETWFAWERLLSETGVFEHIHGTDNVAVVVDKEPEAVWHVFWEWVSHTEDQAHVQVVQTLTPFFLHLRWTSDVQSTACRYALQVAYQNARTTEGHDLYGSSMSRQAAIRNFAAKTFSLLVGLKREPDLG